VSKKNEQEVAQDKKLWDRRGNYSKSLETEEDAKNSKRGIFQGGQRQIKIHRGGDTHNKKEGRRGRLIKGGRQTVS